jgi:3-methyladenine DNA glycosylase AlkC
MPAPLKDLYFPPEFVRELADAMQQVYPAFDCHRFLDAVLDGGWPARELKDRMRHLSHALHATLPADYPQALEILLRAAPSFRGLQAMVFCDYVEVYGLDHWELSLPALATLTPLGSAEFAVRPYLDRDPERAMAYVRAWARDADPAVRRLASEGSRPRLPWAMSLPAFKADPTLVLDVLEQLKDDPSETVRKSVANNLNDISKDHPDLVLEVAMRWLGHSQERDWIVKHACRTMLKAGDQRALRLFGFGDPTSLHVENLVVDRPSLTIGETLLFGFDLNVETPEPCQVRLELGVDYCKARGQLSRKIFQLGEATYAPGCHRLARKHSFQDRSTRKHYPGEHRLAILVNGVEKARVSLQLEKTPRP